MSKEIDVIVVGELNVDIILNQIESFPEIGKEKLAGEMTVTLGSSSAIFASNLSALGAKVAFIGKIGDDNFGELVIDSLQMKGVDTRLIIRDNSAATGATIVLNYDENRAMVTHGGAMEMLTINDIKTNHLAQGHHLHFSSYFLQPTLRPDVMSMFKMAKQVGLSTSFDAQWDPAEQWKLNLREILPWVDIFFPNEQEILHLTGEKSVDAALKSLVPYVNTVVVKCGSKGSLMLTCGGTYKQPSFYNKDVVDAIGAGDSFNAGFIFKFIRGANLKECQKFGNLTGAINTTAAGGTTAFKDNVNIMKFAQERFGYKE